MQYLDHVTFYKAPLKGVPESRSLFPNHIAKDTGTPFQLVTGNQCALCRPNDYFHSGHHFSEQVHQPAPARDNQ